MTQGEKDTLQMLIARLEAMLGERPDYGYGGTTLTDEQSPFVRSWILPKLKAVATPSSARNHLQKSMIRHAQQDWGEYCRRQRRALKPPIETQAGAEDVKTDGDSR